MKRLVLYTGTVYPNRCIEGDAGTSKEAASAKKAPVLCLYTAPFDIYTYICMRVSPLENRPPGHRPLRYAGPKILDLYLYLGYVTMHVHIRSSHCNHNISLRIIVVSIYIHCHTTYVFLKGTVSFLLCTTLHCVQTMFQSVTKHLMQRSLYSYFSPPRL